MKQPGLHRRVPTFIKTNIVGEVYFMEKLSIWKDARLAPVDAMELREFHFFTLDLPRTIYTPVTSHQERTWQVDF